jgi:hypothetical protein
VVADTVGGKLKEVLEAFALGRLLAAHFILLKLFDRLEKSNDAKKGDAMKTKSLKMAIKSILIVPVVGISLTALAGCGISHGPYRSGYDGRNYHNNTDYYSGDYGYSGNAFAAPEYNQYNPGNRVYGPVMGYGSGRSGYCGW